MPRLPRGREQLHRGAWKKRVPPSMILFFKANCNMTTSSPRTYFPFTDDDTQSVSQSGLHARTHSVRPSRQPRELNIRNSARDGLQPATMIYRASPGVKAGVTQVVPLLPGTKVAWGEKPQHGVVFKRAEGGRKKNNRGRSKATRKNVIVGKKCGATCTRGNKCQRMKASCPYHSAER